MTRAFRLDHACSSFQALKEGVGRFKKEPLDPWLACCCALHAWHLSEQVPSAGEQTSGRQKRQEHHRRACPALGYLQDICNSFKHTKITKYAPRIQSAEFQDGDFDHRDFDHQDFDTPRLEVELPDGTTLRFDDILAKAMDYWSTLFRENVGPCRQPPLPCR